MPIGDQERRIRVSRSSPARVLVALPRNLDQQQKLPMLAVRIAMLALRLASSSPVESRIEIAQSIFRPSSTTSLTDACNVR